MSKDRNPLKRIFIVGAPRSGTTLLQSMLSSHPRLCSFTESHFFSKCLKKKLRGLRYEVNPTSVDRVEYFLKENLFCDTDIELLRSIFLAEKSAVQVTQDFIGLLDKYTVERKMTGWIEKTPIHLHHIGFIEKLVNDAIFIHVARKGILVASSIFYIANMHSEIWGERTIKECINRWNSDIKISIKYLKKVNHFGVAFDNFIKDVPNNLKLIFTLLGIEWNDEILNYKKNVDAIISHDEIWKSDNYKSIKKSDKLDKLSVEEGKLLDKFINNGLYVKFKEMSVV